MGRLEWSGRDKSASEIDKSRFPRLSNLFHRKTTNELLLSEIPVSVTPKLSEPSEYPRNEDVKEVGITQETRSNDPIVVIVGDVSLIGVSHGAQLEPTRPDEYGKAVDQADHLLLEGISKFYGPHKTDYEGTAYLTFKEEKGDKNIHFLEEGIDRLQLLIKAGVDEEIVQYKVARSSILVPMFSNGFAGDVPKLDKLSLIADILKSEYASLFADVSYPQMVARLDKWSHDLFQARDVLVSKPNDTDMVKRSFLQLGFEGFELITDYGLEVTDTKIFIPRIKQLIEELPGKKAVCVGADHLPAIANVLRGRSPKPPVPWAEHVRGFSPAQQEALEVFEEMARARPSRREV